jgi:hypothetical protein
MCATVLFSVTVQVGAEFSADDLKRNILEHSQKIAEYQTLLDDPDQAVRLAALDVMLKSDDMATRALAYDVGLKSSNDPMRAVALKNRVAGLAALVVKVELRDNATEDERKVNTKMGRNLRLRHEVIR